MVKSENTREYLEELKDLHGVHVFSVPYCGLQFLLNRYEEKCKWYSSGEYGWDWDAYVFKDRNIIICTGYRDMAGDEIPYEIYSLYNKKARSLDMGYTKGSFDKLLNEFFDKVLEWAGE